MWSVPLNKFSAYELTKMKEAAEMLKKDKSIKQNQRNSIEKILTRIQSQNIGTAV